MKKIIISVFLSVFTVVNCLASEISVNLFGEPVNFYDQGAEIINDRTYVPARGIFEKLNYAVDWNQEKKLVTLISSADNKAIFLMPDVSSVLVCENYSEVNLVNITNDSYKQYCTEIKTENAPVLLNGRIMLPLRVIAELSGYEIAWEKDTKSVYISASLDFTEFEKFFIDLENFVKVFSDLENDYTGKTLKSEYSFAQSHFNEFINYCEKQLSKEPRTQEELNTIVKKLNELLSVVLNNISEK